jgi:hypothetical protein
MSAAAKLFGRSNCPTCPRRTSRKSSSTANNFPHVASLNWQAAKAWKKDGSLVVSIDSMIDAAGSSITATRMVVLGFDPAGEDRDIDDQIRNADGLILLRHGLSYLLALSE